MNKLVIRILQKNLVKEEDSETLNTNDIWIAASSMQHGLSLYTFDRHFSAIDGILLYSTSS